MKKIKMLLVLLLCMAVYAFFAVASTDTNTGSSGKNTTASGTADENNGETEPTATPEPTKYVSSVKPNMEELTEYQLGRITGTYITEKGRALSLYSDGSSRQVYNPFNELEEGDTWQYRDGIVTINCPRQNCDFSFKMDVTEPDSEMEETSGDYQLKKSGLEYELLSTAENFEAEHLLKVLEDEKLYTMDEYKEIIGEYFPEALITPSPTPTPTPSPSPSPTPIPNDMAVNIKVTNKTTQKTTLQEFSVFSIDIENNTERTIRGVRAIFTIGDLFGKKIASYEVDFTGKTIKAGSKTSYKKNVEMNQFLNETVKIYKEKYDDLSFDFKIEKIAYEDEIKETKNVTKGSDEVKIECIGKTNIEANILEGIYSDYSSFEFKITNESSKDIRGIQGNFYAYNLFGECILKGEADFTGKKIPAGGSTKMKISKEINMFIDDDQDVQRESYDDLFFEYEVISVVYYES